MLERLVFTIENVRPFTFYLAKQEEICSFDLFNAYRAKPFLPM